MLEALRPQIGAVLALVQGRVAELGARAHQSHKRHRGRDNVPVYAEGQPLLRLVSPLAEGADRLVAEEAGKLNYVLDVVLPLRKQDYEQDFLGSVEQFERLLATAEQRVLVVDGGPNEERARSYQAAGRLVVRNSDLIIAIWDGKPGRGDGGTADIVGYAARFGVPVWWINTDANAPGRLLSSLAQLRRPAQAPTGSAAEKALSEYLAHTILPPDHPEPKRNGTLGRAVHLACRVLAHDPPPVQVYLRETEIPPAGLWTVYKTFVTWAGGLAAPSSGMKPAEGTVGKYWEAQYSIADSLSGQYAARYRSSYVLVFVVSALGFLASVTSLAFPGVGSLCTVVELLVIFSIGSLVVANHAHGWHERWITYRLLAELCRKQRVLATLGRGVPGTEISALANDAGAELGKVPREAWVAWYFAAAQRAAPQPAGALNEAALAHAADVAREMLVEQIDYHKDRRHRCRAANEKLAQIGGSFFALTAALVVLGAVSPLQPDNAVWLNITGCVLAIISAAFVGIRAYAEFDLLAEESDRMLRVMEAGRAAIDATKFGHPLASQDLGAEISTVAAAMLLDVKGWAQLFRVKAIDAN